MIKFKEIVLSDDDLTSVMIDGEHFNVSEMSFSMNSTIGATLKIKCFKDVKVKIGEDNFIASRLEIILPDMFLERV